MTHLSIRGRRDRRVASALIAVLALSHVPAMAQSPALPQGAQVVQGSATVSSPSGAAMTISQESARAIIDWRDFSIGAGGRVTIQQPGAAAALLNRVTGGNMSLINGQLSANGKVYLINPQGITVGPTGVVDTAAFVGSTLNTSNSGFMAGSALNFAGESAAGVINLGTIRTSSGDVVIIAPRISNQGTIDAPGGTAALLAGREVLYAPGGPNPFVIKAPISSDAAAVDNTGSIRAAEAVLKAAGSPYALAVNNGGAISATTVTQAGGRIILDGGEGQTTNSGSLSATGTTGGAIDVLGATVELTAGAIDVSGQSGGGDVRIGGGFRGQDASVANARATSVAAGVTIRANAGERGDGGSVVAWAEGTTEFRGAIEARGGSTGGNGGQAEVSGHELTYLGRTDLSAEAGATGTLLLDPGSHVIDGAAAATIQADLDTTNVIVNGYDDITVGASITNNTTTNMLTLDAPVIVVNESISLTAGDIQFGDGFAGTSLTSASGASISAFTISISNGFQAVNFAGPLVAPNNGLSISMTSGSPGSFSATNAGNQLKNLYMNNTSITGSFDIRSAAAMQMSGTLSAGGDVTMVATGGDLAFSGGGCGGTEIESSGTTTLASTTGAFNSNGNLTLSGAGRKRIYSSTSSGTFNVSGLAYPQYTGVSYPSDPQAGNVIYIAEGAALPALTITADNQSARYGDGDPVYTASYSGGSAGDLTSPVRFSIGGAHSNVGTYTITPFGAASSTHQLAYVNGTLTILPAPLLITAPTLAMSYGSDLPAFRPTYSGFKNSDGPEVVSGLRLTTSASSQSGIGTYRIVAAGAAASNYAISYADGALTITPAVLRVIANNSSRLYGAANPLFTVSYSGLLNGDLPSVVSGVSTSTTAVERSNVGGYPIVPSGGAAANYTLDYVQGTLTVTPAPLSVSTASASLTYGDSVPALTTTAAGLVAGDTVSSLGLGYTTSVIPGTGVGVYPTAISGSASNYAVTYLPGLLTISPKALRIRADDARRDQFTSNPLFTATVTGLFGNDQVKGLQFSTPGDVSAPAGQYPILPSADADPNYATTFEAGTLTVDPPPPIIVTMEQDWDTPVTIPNFITAPVSDVSIAHTGVSLGSLVVNSSSVLARAMEAFIQSQKLTDGAAQDTRTEYVALLRNNQLGDGDKIGAVLPFLLDQAKSIVDRDPSTWTSEERDFVAFVTDSIGAQRRKAAEAAADRLQTWKDEQRARIELQGVASVFDRPVVPSDAFLTEANSGLYIEPDRTATVAGVIASAAASAAVAGGAAAGSSAIIATVAPFAGVAAKAAGEAGMVVGTTFTAGAAAAVSVAVVILSIVAIGVASVDAVNAADYDRKMDEAVQNAQQPVSISDLKNMLATEEGQKLAFLRLAAEVSNQSGTR